MKKRNLIIVIGILALAFCINSCSKKNDNNSDNTQVAGKNENTKADNSEMTVAGYALGEILLCRLGKTGKVS